MSPTATVPSAQDADAGSAGDLVTAFATAVRGASPDPTPGLVATAFSLGWYLGALCESGDFSVVDAVGGEFAGIDEPESINFCLRQVEVGCTKLRAIVETAGQEPLYAAELAEAIQTRSNGGRAGPAQRLHLKAFSILSAVDFRLGRAYGLGRDMLHLTAAPPSAGTLMQRLSDTSVAPIVATLDDLSSAFPPHAGHAVRASLVEWNLSVEGGGVSKEVQDRVAPEGQATSSLLRRQGQLWRAVLSGEKSGRDMLEIGDYIDAAQRLSTRMRAIAGRGLREFPGLVAAVVLLFCGGIALMVLTDNAATAAAGAGGVLASLGLTWKGVGGALGRLARQVEDPLWGAELDQGITRAITLLKPLENRDVSAERRRFALALGAPEREQQR
jgi:hypothetical protein